MRCSQAIARINRQEIIRSIEELPEPPPNPVLLHAMLPYCVAGDSQSPRHGYLDALQYALTRTPMTKQVLLVQTLPRGGPLDWCSRLLDVLACDQLLGWSHSPA